MELLQRISEDEMIAVFLRAEVDSPRYGAKLLASLRRDGRAPLLLREPDLADAEANAYRRGLLDEHRAYERRDGLFLGFPQDVDWYRASLGRDEVLDILYIDWDWWLELTGGTRRPRDAARRIRAGEVAEADLEADERFAASLAASVSPPELIAVTTPARTPLVLVEGHARLTAYATHPEHLRERLEMLVGISGEVQKWSQF